MLYVIANDLSIRRRFIAAIPITYMLLLVVEVVALVAQMKVPSFLFRGNIIYLH